MLLTIECNVYDENFSCKGCQLSIEVANYVKMIRLQRLIYNLQFSMQQNEAYQIVQLSRIQDLIYTEYTSDFSKIDKYPINMLVS